MTDYRHELNRFPKFFLPETRVKEPIEGGVYTALPKGKRVFIWFTYCKSKNICFIVDGETIRPAHAAFPNYLALGTVLSGILVARVFTADTLLCGATDLAKVMRDLDCPVYLPTQLKFQCAVSSLNPFFDAPYKIQCVKCVHGSTVTFYEEKYATFQVSALPTSDVYELLDLSGNKCVANIDSYQRSVAMNALFRSVSANKYLDLGEESDDDSDAAVGPPLMMECRWHYKHRQWIPQECVLSFFN